MSESLNPSATTSLLAHRKGIAAAVDEAFENISCAVGADNGQRS